MSVVMVTVEHAEATLISLLIWMYRRRLHPPVFQPISNKYFAIDVSTNQLEPGFIDYEIAINGVLRKG